MKKNREFFLVDNFYDKVVGSLIGLAVGDALGAPLKDNRRLNRRLLKKPAFMKSSVVCDPIVDMIGGGPFNLAPGEWSNETSMAIALSESLIRCNGFNEKDLLLRFADWLKRGKYSHRGECFDLDQTTQIAILDSLQSGNPFGGSYDPELTGHGSIARVAPVAMFYNEDPKSAFHVVTQQSRLTHADPLCLNICQQMMLDFLNMYRGFAPQQIWKDDVKNMKQEEIQTMYVKGVYDAAKWAIQNTDNFKDAVLLAVNLRARDSDSVGAVTGELAGAAYGLSGIPPEWVEKLAWKEYLLRLADRIYYDED